MTKKLLFIRLDKIGDLVCTLCSDDHPDLNEYSKHWLISKGLGFVPDHAVPKRLYTSLTKDIFGFVNLYKFLRQNAFAGSISFQCPWWVHLLLFNFQIPIRVGVLSQWHSFLFLNAGIRQKRSQATRHESDYNFELVDYLAQKIKAKTSGTQPNTPLLKLHVTNTYPVLQKCGLKSGNYFIVHPGMAGSALNWPQENYIQFIRSFHSSFPNLKVVMTGTHSDYPLVEKILSVFEKEDYFVNLQAKINSEELLSVLSDATGILAPSTGVLHLAASLGIPTFGIFSPIKVQQPTRWGPRGAKVKTYLPVTNDENCMKDLDIFLEFKNDFEKMRR